MDKKEMMDYLAAEVTQCTACHVLASKRKRTVFGRGNPEALIAIIGEAPGQHEDEQGFPFVGNAGALLDNILKACKIPQDEVYICNVVKCRPPDNRLPDRGEISRCGKFLELQLRILDPMFIVCMGAVAAQRITGSDKPIGQLRGSLTSFRQWGLNAKVICTYHPSFLLRDHENKKAERKAVWDDMQLMLRTLKSGLQT